MIRYLLLSISLLLGTHAISQVTNLSDYHYVVVPEQFEFLKGKDQYKMNSMAKFYFDKNGFNAYFSDSAPNANRCDGLFANVEELNTILGTKLQVVLKDCNDKEVYRGGEGKSKFKMHKKAYQDALRKAFSSIELMHVDQKDVVLLERSDKTVSTTDRAKVKEILEPKHNKVRQASKHSGNLLPDAKYSSYLNSGKSFLLRKTSEGYTLYEEDADAEDGLVLQGKVIIMDQILKYMDAAGNVSDATFDSSGNLTVKKDGASQVYKIQN
ncbi:hypothetical protein [Aequorivita marina]|uniref:hypothetical protein n=1 Tax=Aequorivita marina TaxID=3073654 RepID=UPI0028750FEF|nr:hypothetical protein [Aequorivita sp. S2608]MDS1296937.1 hypothetical protein [Aequorivita sp. S2608]